MISKLLSLFFSAILMLSFTACSVEEEDSRVGASDGSASSPVTLTLDTPYAAGVGQYQYSEDYSYYKFTTGLAGDYTYTSTTTGDLSYYLYNTADFYLSSQIEYGNTSGVFTDLSANTTYYLKVYNYWGSSDYTFDLTINAPVLNTLALNTTTAGSLTTATQSVYYSFEAISGASYLIDWTEDSVDIVVSASGAMDYFVNDDFASGGNIITANATETIMIKVESYSSSIVTGYFTVTATQQ